MFNKKNITFFILGISLLVGCGGGYVYFTLKNLPKVETLKTCFTGAMHGVKVCSKSENYVPLSEVSEHFINALIVSEDAGFWAHEGLDWFEIQESFKKNFEKGKMARGGSTLTQQLVKNAFLSPEKSISRKIKEAVLALEIEKQFSKKFILEKYVNIVEFGDNLFGIKPAALHYFSKHPAHLNPLESAFLVFLLPNPKKYSKSFQEGALTDFAKSMVKLILERLKFYKRIDQESYDFSIENLDEFPWGGLWFPGYPGEIRDDLENIPLEIQILEDDRSEDSNSI